MTSVLIVDQDPLACETIRHQLDIHGYYSVVAAHDKEAQDIIDQAGRSLSGLIVNVELDGGSSGWEIARRLRELNPAVAVGYMSASGHRDWAINGVPGSILVSTPGGDHDIPKEFFRLCQVGLSAGARTDAPANDERLTDAIQRERDVLQEHLQHTPSLIVFLEGPEHCFTFANQSYIGLVEREVVGQTVAEAFPEATQQGFVEILDRVYTSGEDFVAHGLEFRIELGNGATKTTYLDLVYRSMRAADGRIYGIFVEGEDITARLDTQERIAQLQNELIYNARINAMGVLASTLAHELNQPLASVQNFVSAAAMMAERRSLDADFIECLEGASKSALRAGEIIRRLRAMTVRGAVKRGPVAIEPCLREAVGIACLGRVDVQVAYDLGWTGLVRADPVQLQQVVVNLVRNALDAAEVRDPDLLVSTIDEGAFVRCCIRDAGTGIAETVLPRIFDAFATTKENGMGVGLSLSKTIVESHGGTLTACNNEDGGATLAFTLPKAVRA